MALTALLRPLVFAYLLWVEEAVVATAQRAEILRFVAVLVVLVGFLKSHRF
jgi:hypothetical protein